MLNVGMTDVPGVAITVGTAVGAGWLVAVMVGATVAVMVALAVGVGPVAVALAVGSGQWPSAPACRCRLGCTAPAPGRSGRGLILFAVAICGHGTPNARPMRNKLSPGRTVYWVVQAAALAAGAIAAANNPNAKKNAAKLETMRFILLAPSGRSRNGGRPLRVPHIHFELYAENRHLRRVPGRANLCAFGINWGRTEPEGHPAHASTDAKTRSRTKAQTHPEKLQEKRTPRLGSGEYLPDVTEGITRVEICPSPSRSGSTGTSNTNRARAVDTRRIEIGSTPVDYTMSGIWTRAARANWRSPIPNIAAPAATILQCRYVYLAPALSHYTHRVTPGPHRKVRVALLAVRTVVEDGLPYAPASWRLWRDFLCVLRAVGDHASRELGGSQEEEKGRPAGLSTIIWTGPWRTSRATLRPLKCTTARSACCRHLPHEQGECGLSTITPSSACSTRCWNVTKRPPRRSSPPFSAVSRLFCRRAGGRWLGSLPMVRLCTRGYSHCLWRNPASNL